MTDGYFIRRAQSGDKDALDKLIRRHYDKIYSYCFYRLNDRQSAEDICQDTFCSMLEHLEEYRHYDKFQNYLYVIAGNKCKDFYKKKKFFCLEEIPGNRIPGNGVSGNGISRNGMPESGSSGKGIQERELLDKRTQAVELDDRILIRELVRSLPKDLEEIVILRYYQDLRYQDIAKILQISTSLAKYRVKKAIEQLREQCEGRGYV